MRCPFVCLYLYLHFVCICSCVLTVLIVHKCTAIDVYVCTYVCAPIRVLIMPSMSVPDNVWHICALESCHGLYSCVYPHSVLGTDGFICVNVFVDVLLLAKVKQ